MPAKNNKISIRGIYDKFIIQYVDRVASSCLNLNDNLNVELDERKFSDNI